MQPKCSNTISSTFKLYFSTYKILSEHTTDNLRSNALRNHFNILESGSLVGIWRGIFNQ